MKKRILSMMLSLAMISSVISMPVYAEEVYDEDSDIIEISYEDEVTESDIVEEENADDILNLSIDDLGYAENVEMSGNASAVLEDYDEIVLNDFDNNGDDYYDAPIPDWSPEGNTLRTMDNPSIADASTTDKIIINNATSGSTYDFNVKFQINNDEDFYQFSVGAQQYEELQHDLSDPYSVLEKDAKYDINWTLFPIKFSVANGSCEVTEWWAYFENCGYDTNPRLRDLEANVRMVPWNVHWIEIPRQTPNDFDKKAVYTNGLSETTLHDVTYPVTITLVGKLKINNSISTKTSMNTSLEVDVPEYFLQPKLELIGEMADYNEYDLSTDALLDESLQNVPPEEREGIRKTEGILVYYNGGWYKLYDTYEEMINAGYINRHDLSNPVNIYDYVNYIPTENVFNHDVIYCLWGKIEPLYLGPCKFDIEDKRNYKDNNGNTYEAPFVFGRGEQAINPYYNEHYEYKGTNAYGFYPHDIDEVNIIQDWVYDKDWNVIQYGGGYHSNEYPYYEYNLAYDGIQRWSLNGGNIRALNSIPAKYKYTTAKKTAKHFISIPLEINFSGTSSPDGPTDIPVYEAQNLVVNQKLTIPASDLACDTIKSFKYSTKNLATASLKNGTVTITAKKAGDVTITALDKNKDEIGSVDIHITKPVVNKVTSYRLGEVITKDKLISEPNTVTKWTSSKPTVASIDETTGTVTVNKTGSTTITAYYGEGKNAAKYTTTLTVKLPSLNPASVTLKETKTKTIKIKNCSLTPTWSSEDTSIATVDSLGKITAVHAGETNIIANIDGVDYKCKLFVAPTPYKVTAIKRGDVISNNKIISEPGLITKWTSSKTSVATVDENGNVTIIGSGKATITAYIGEGKKAKKYKATVTVKLPTVNQTSVKVGKEKQITTKNTQLTVTNWRIEDTSIATVSDTGLVTGISKGTTYVYATVDGVEYKGKVVVK